MLDETAGRLEHAHRDALDAHADRDGLEVRVGRLDMENAELAARGGTLPPRYRVCCSAGRRIPATWSVSWMPGACRSGISTCSWSIAPLRPGEPLVCLIINYFIAL